jgi:hypothetical protein
VDSDSLNPNPDPAFQVNLIRIRIQGFDDEKIEEKNTADIFFFFI